MALVAAALVAMLAPAAFAQAAPGAGPRPLTDALDAPFSPLDLTAVTFGQQGARMTLQVTTAAPWSARQLDTGAGRSICIKLFYGRLGRPRARVCVLARDGAPRLRYTRLDPSGKPVALHRLKATVMRPDSRSLRATFTPASVRLRVGRYAWRAETSWAVPGPCATPGTCTDRAPDNAAVPARIAPSPLPRGCVAHGRTQRRSGPRGSPRVALTFDDGPSRFTPAILRLLKRKHVPATFFVLGKEVRRHRSLLRRMLREGHMIANHTLTHANVAGAGGFARHQISATQSIINRASGFKPCLFRPPYAATSRALTRIVRSLGALSILWDVDPQDWRTPGTAAVSSNVLRNTRPGSIILLHDGGGPRAQTIAALPRIIDTLRRRGLRFVTVADLLHLRLRARRTAA